MSNQTVLGNGSIEVEECGGCGAYHRADFYGDCRDDSERIYELTERHLIVSTIEEQLANE
jgi:hypothetical protein